MLDKEKFIPINECKLYRQPFRCGFKAHDHIGPFCISTVSDRIYIDGSMHKDGEKTIEYKAQFLCKVQVEIKPNVTRVLMEHSGYSIDDAILSHRESINACLAVVDNFKNLDDLDLNKINLLQS